MNPLSSLTFILTDACNFRCSYCPQKKEDTTMDRETVAKAVDFFYPYFKSETMIIFYGGEPLLAFDLIQYTVSLLQQKNMKSNISQNENPPHFKYSVTTNGSLLTPQMLDFFEFHHFSIILSFDAYSQDSARQQGTMEQTRELIRQLQTRPNIHLTLNCVVSPDTVSQFSASMAYIIDTGVADVMMSPSFIHPWDPSALQTLTIELEKLSQLLFIHYREKGTVPITNFRPQSGPKKKHGCSAALDRLSLSPHQYVWGCFAFHPLLKDKQGSEEFNAYSFGQLDQFILNHETLYPKILANYQELRQECFFTQQRSCFLCQDVDECGACPADAAYATSFIGELPLWYCDLAQTIRKAKKEFQKNFSA